MATLKLEIDADAVRKLMHDQVAELEERFKPLISALEFIAEENSLRSSDLSMPALRLLVDIMREAARSALAEYAKREEPEWTEWTPRDMCETIPPIAADALVEVELRGGGRGVGPAGSLFWHATKNFADSEIVRYRKINSDAIP